MTNLTPKWKVLISFLALGSIVMIPIIVGLTVNPSKKPTEWELHKTNIERLDNEYDSITKGLLEEANDIEWIVMNQEDFTSLVNGGLIEDMAIDLSHIESDTFIFGTNDLVIKNSYIKTNEEVFIDFAGSDTNLYIENSLIEVKFIGWINNLTATKSNIWLETKEQQELFKIDNSPEIIGLDEVNTGWYEDECENIQWSYVK